MTVTPHTSALHPSITTTTSRKHATSHYKKSKQQPSATTYAHLKLKPVKEMSAKDLMTAEKVMNDFVLGKLGRLGMDFKVWDWSRSELFGVLLGTFVTMDLVPDSETLTILLEFMIDVSAAYFRNPYHSFLHAVDVEYMMYYILIDLKVAHLLDLSKAEITALLVAALTHDVLHPGLNNLYQVNAHTELAQRYTDMSVLENHSCAHVEKLLTKHPFLERFTYGDNITSDLVDADGNPLDTPSAIKEMVLDAILSTDMCFHFTLLDHLSLIAEQYGSSSSSSSSTSPTSSGVSSLSSCQLRENSHILHDHHCEPNRISSTTASPATDIPKHVVENGLDIFKRLRSFRPHENGVDGGTGGDDDDVCVLDAYEEMTEGEQQGDEEIIPQSLRLGSLQKRQMVNVLLHAADISNAARPYEICKRWSDMIIEEFFLQGEQEKMMNLPVSPNMDRDSTDQIQVSIQFNDYVTRPFFEVLADLLPPIQVFVDILFANRAEWEGMMIGAGVDAAPTESEVDAEEEVPGGVVVSAVTDASSSADVAAPIEETTSTPSTRMASPNPSKTVEASNGTGAGVGATLSFDSPLVTSSPSTTPATTVPSPDTAAAAVSGGAGASGIVRGRRLSIAAGT
ncbi:High affinity cAMP-specific and IBMX-insensitive 3',5'-cyclic phosphodiesterase 9A, partial [Quaeritorhiza haematococci]